ncbi:sushi, von Willebrand factor type A, EGF and pentraxin domain-containing protein 1-like [Gigantopelta aegis]|uniref:sushi, von Willebrand factor type A, EGF and pentraxin domain-containing protein 1-like n=1 Tax=Gigantopelta aegis TaxID=1735272 RepID=UPI001B888734|nr:sushi, von Willebrand factor type A, EGF and pentraxin domain-containing protein 1-like [Gigantopelta aegis]
MHDKTKFVCSICPTGFYQDEAGQFECKTCTTAVIAGARTRDNCTEVCAAGHFSSNGVIPCDGCPIGQYQPNSGSKNCLSCDYGTTTTNTATTDPDACQEFDMRVEGPALVSSTGSLQNSTDDFTITTWFTTGAEASLGIKQSDGSFPFQLFIEQNLTLNVSGNETTDFELPTSSWIHLTVVHANKTVTVYTHGKVALSKTLTSVSTPAISCGSRLELGVQSDSAVDECQQNSPCNGHTCVNMPGSYRCECQGGYSGSDYCADTKCEDGKCENRTNDYVCNCIDGFKGQFCDEQIVLVVAILLKAYEE